MSRFFLGFCQFLVRSFFFLFTNCHVIGRENIPVTGPLLVTSNHLTFAEPPLIGVLLGRDCRFAAREGFFRYKLVGKAFTAWGGFPVSPGKANIKAIKMMEQFLEQGLAVVIFPEGHRSTTAQLGLAMQGAALLALHTRSFILPVSITGTEKMKGLLWYFKRPGITVKFGKPFNLTLENDKTGRETATGIIMEHIAAQLPPEYRGVYALREASNDS